MHFDWTINFGTILWGFTNVVLIVITWRDFSWRIKNLETWRKESITQYVELARIQEKRDELIQMMNISIERLSTLIDVSQRRLEILEERDRQKH